MPPKKDTTAKEAAAIARRNSLQDAQAQPNNEVNVSEKRLSEMLDTKLALLKDSIIQTLSSEIAKLQSKNAQLSKAFDKQQLQIEQLETQARANNIIITGIPEGENQQQELKSIGAICKMVSKEISVSSITGHHRIGKKVDGKKRITKVIFHDRTSRNSVLYGDRTPLKNNTYKDIYINADESELTRAEGARLRKKMHEMRKSAPNSKVVITKGRLMKDDNEIDAFDIRNQMHKSHD
jgi:multidrug efflux pump subunit AcrA (membrane-fusion protein)